MSQTSDGLFGRLPLPERRWVSEALRDETTGGILLLAAATIALIWANSPWADAYFELSSTVVGPAALHLNLPLSVWAADGLLAIFFFVAGVELRHEFQLGTLANVRKAAVPIAAAIGGMAVPAILYSVVNSVMAGGEPGGWGIPMATDIAFALAVLAVVGRNLPVALRAFLLSLAVVDDLGAIAVIAIFYSHGFDPGAFAISVVLLAVYGILQWRRVTGWPIYVALAIAAWGFMHASGIHATVAGVAAGLLTRVKPDPGEDESPGERAEHVIRPISAGVAVPLFAFFAAGVSVRGTDVATLLTGPVAVGVIVGLVVGKPIGVVGTAWLMARFTKASLAESIRWRDVVAIGLLAGIGFTVSLLIAELAFEDAPTTLSAAKLAVLAASVISAIVASVVIVTRNRYYAQLAAVEDADIDHDGVPDVYQRGPDDPA
ncbi:MAG: Na+/H+ antiporter NhaA [Candidatus Nanopelagicales bacterium]